MNLETQAVETVGGEVIPRSAVCGVRHEGNGTSIPPLESREIVLLLSMIGGMPHHQLIELAREGMEPKDRPAPKRPLGRPRKRLLPAAGSWTEIPIGLKPSGVLTDGRLDLEEDADAVLY